MAGKKEDLSGRTFGKLLVIGFHGIEKEKTKWLCRCECGKVKPIRADALKRGTRTCGCATIEAAKEFEDLTGKIFSRLVVLRKSDKRGPADEILWECQCQCGSVVSVRVGSLSSGHTRSCGCLHKESAAKQAIAIGKANTRHGMTHTVEYDTWHGIRLRCQCQTQPAYPNYGGRGVKVCERWQVFENFLEDMGPRPSSKHSIDRIDTNGDYCPENCRWATWKEQQRNRSNNVKFLYEGQMRTIAELAEIAGIPMYRLWCRLRKQKLPLEEAMKKELQRKRPLIT